MNDFHNDLDDNDEEEEREIMYGGRDGLIFLVDSTLPMFHKGNEEEVPFKTCMECCKTTMLNKIISSGRDLISVVLFGTSQSDNQLSAAHITTLQELSEPSADKVKQLEKIINSKDFDGFADKYGHSTDFALSDALWLCQTLFSTSVYKLGSYRILLLTNTSNPHSGMQRKQHQARVRASDLSQAGIQLELLHMGANFDSTLFYKELVQLSRGDNDDDFELPDPTSSFDELLERACRLDYKKRALCKLHFNLGGDVSFTVNLYNLVRKTGMPRRMNLERTSNEQVKSRTQYLNVVTSEVMVPAELSKCQIFADKKILLRNDEVRSLLKMTSPGLELLGFKPSSRVKLHHHCKPSAFIYPEEGLIAGSRTLFAALLERCAARSVVPICYMTPRQNSAPQLVALVPQLEKLNKAGLQRSPPGFHVVYLPYADSIRSLTLSNPTKASNQQINLMGDIIEKLRFNYQPSLFDNPRLQKIWSNIEALALDHDQPEEVCDYTLPSYKQMTAKLQGLSLEFVKSVYPPGYDPSTTKKPPAAKRPPGTSGASTSAAKAPRMSAAGSDAAVEDVVAMVHAGQVSKLTVAQLKAYLQNVGVHFAYGVLKAGLIELVVNHVKG